MRLLPFEIITLLFLLFGIVLFIILLKRKAAFPTERPIEYFMVVVFIALIILLYPFSWEEYKYDNANLVVKGLMAFGQSFQNAIRAFLLDGPWSDWKTIRDISDTPLYSVIGIILSTVAPIMTFERLINIFKSRTEQKWEFRNKYNTNKEYNVHEDLELTLKKAKQGDDDAMYAVANMFFYGIAGQGDNTDRNFEQAVYWFRRLSESKDSKHKAYALKYLSHMYYAGMIPGERQDYTKSYQYAVESAAEDPGLIRGHLAFLKSVGSGCVFNFDEVVDLYEEANTNGDVSLKIGLSDFYKTYGMFEQASKIYEQILSQFENNDGETESAAYSSAAFELGMMYKKGLITDNKMPDYEKAKEYFSKADLDGRNKHNRKSKEQCRAELYLEWGKLYFNPTANDPETKPPKPDFHRAQELLLIAADRGNVEACYILGYMYQNGHVEYSLKKARKYHTIAADKGHSGSMVALANIYQQKVCRNYSLAFKYAKMAAESRHAEGCFIYANLLFIGRGCKADIEEAKENYEYAKKHGCVQADFMLERLIRIYPQYKTDEESA